MFSLYVFVEWKVWAIQKLLKDRLWFCCQKSVVLKLVSTVPTNILAGCDYMLTLEVGREFMICESLKDGS